jgi:hypothetical protein
MSLQENLTLGIPALLDFAEEPGASEGPPALDGGDGNTELFGGLFLSQSNEETEVNQLGTARIGLAQAFERLVQREQFVIGQGRGQFQVLDIQSFQVSSMLEPFLSTGDLDKDPAHGFSSRGEKIGPSGKPGALTTPEP